MSIDLAAYGRMLWRHKWFVVALMLAGAVMGFLSILFLPNVYQARATMEALGLNENFMGMSQVDPQAGLYTLTAVNLGTQIRLIESSKLRAAAAEKVSTQNIAVNLAPTDSLTRLRVRVQEFLGIIPKDPVEQTNEAVQSASRSLRAGPIEGTRLMEIRCESTNPAIAADYINTLTSIYIDQELQERLRGAQRNVRWLANQAEELKKRAEEAEGRLQDYARTMGASTIPQQETLAESRMRQLQMDLAQFQADRISRQARLEAAKRSPETLDDPGISQAHASLAVMRQELVGLRLRITPEHPRVRELQARISEVESAQRKAQSAVIDRLQSEYAAALDRERKLLSAYESQSRSVTQQSDRLSGYNLLKREAEAGRQLYQQMTQQVQQAAAVTGVPTQSLRTVEPADPPIKPTSPNIPLNTSLGAATGLLFGCVIAFIRWQVDTTIRVPDDLQANVGGRQLAIVPSYESALAFEQRRSLLSRFRFRRQSPVNGDLTAPAPQINTATILLGADGEPLTGSPLLMSESFRTLIASLVSPDGSGPSNRVLTICSAHPGEGKSTITANLGAALAETRWRVVLVEADLRRPRLHDLLGLDRSPGLTDIIEATRPIADYAIAELVLSTKIPRLYVLPAGAALDNPIGILYSDRIQELIARLRLEFDFVLIDTPPVLVVPDTQVVGRYSDGAILVVGSGTSDRTSVMEARQRLFTHGVPCLGVVLNNFIWRASSGRYPKSNYYSYYHHKAAE